MGRKKLEQVGTLFTPDIILRWYKKLVTKKWDCSNRGKRKSGRPRLPDEVKQLVIRIAKENSCWGYDWIADAVANVGYKISDESVRKILKEQGIEPAPDRKRQTTWSTFLKSDWGVLVAIDFNTVEVWTKGGLVTFYFLFSSGTEDMLSSIRWLYNQSSFINDIYSKLQKQARITSLQSVNGIYCWFNHFYHSSEFSNDFRPFAG